MKRLLLLVALSCSVGTIPYGDAQQQICTSGKCSIPASMSPTAQYIQGAVVNDSSYSQSVYGTPYSTSGCSGPACSQTVYAQPVYAQPATPQPVVYSQPVNVQPVYAQPVYSQTVCNQPAYSQPVCTSGGYVQAQSVCSQPVYTQAGYVQSQTVCSQPMYTQQVGCSSSCQPQVVYASNGCSTSCSNVCVNSCGTTVYSQPVYSAPASYIVNSTSSQVSACSNTCNPTYSTGTYATNAAVTSSVSVAPEYTTTSSVETSSGGLAQQKAEQAARMNFRGHVGGGFGGARYEGVGWSSRSAQAAIQQCCYWGQRTPAEIGVARGSDGIWYACVLYH